MLFFFPIKDRLVEAIRCIGVAIDHLVCIADNSFSYFWNDIKIHVRDPSWNDFWIGLCFFPFVGMVGQAIR